MTILHGDNFVGYGVAGQNTYMKNGIYATAHGDIVNDPTGSGNPCWRSVTDIVPQTGLTYALPNGAVTTVGMAFRLWVSQVPTDTSINPGVFVKDASNNPLIGIGLNPTGGINLYFGGSTTILASTTTPVVTANGWWHIEVKFTTGSSTGAVEVRVEGDTVLTTTGQNYGSAGIGLVGWGNILGTTDDDTFSYYKDVVVWDTNGSQNNNFLGSVLVGDIPLTSDVTFTGWTSTGANGFSVLNNTDPANDGTNFIGAPTPPPTAGVFAHATLPPNTTSVKAIITRVRAKKSDGGDGSLQTSLISGTSTVNGANRPITITYTYWEDVFEIDPATSAPWTITNANASELKINRTL